MNLPVIDRYAPDGELEKKILTDFKIKVNLPIENIEIWRSQFK